jgi:hypothetical protein
MWGLFGSIESDPGYYVDFWNALGYLGHDDPNRFDSVRIRATSTVQAVAAGSESPIDVGALASAAGAVRDHTVAIALDGEFDDLEALFGCILTFVTGGASGRSVIISSVNGDMLSTSGEYRPEMFDGVSVGECVSSTTATSSPGAIGSSTTSPLTCW